MSPAACPGPSASGVSGSRTGAMKCVTVCVLGSRIGNGVGRVLRRAEQRAVGIDGRIAPVRGDQVVQVLLLVDPVPGGDDDVALDSLAAAAASLRQFTLGDAVGPIREILEGDAAEATGQLVHHRSPDWPEDMRRIHASSDELELTELLRDRARGKLSQLMAADAADVLHLLEPVDLRDLLGDVALAAELARVRDLQHRIPVDRRIVLCRLLLSGAGTAARFSCLPGSPSTFGESIRP